MTMLQMQIIQLLMKISKEEDLHKIADMTVNNTGIEDMDRYPEKLTVEDIEGILQRSYK